MRTPEEAITQILGAIDARGEVEHAPLSTARGRILGAEVHSDVDLPPFEKSMMDGFAVRSADLGTASEGAQVWLDRVGESRAGSPFTGSVPPGSCAEIYTGAEVPADCDAVVMIEHTERDGERVAFSLAVRPEQNIGHRGEILTQGGRVFAPGRPLSAADLSVLAAVGCEPVPVFRRPRVTIFTTGDELVPAGETPGHGEIREGNTLFLSASCGAIGVEVLRCEILPDDPDRLEREFEAALTSADALITTGGVSMGRYDLVGATLEKLGVERVLHKVAIKPGKPIWFGLRGATPVFGLPGNPVSSLLGFEVFVRPALLKMGGAEPALWAERLLRGRWLGEPTRPGDRQQNLPCGLRRAADGLVELLPLPWRGSADIVGVADARGLAVVPAGEVLETGALANYRPLDAPIPF